MAEALPPRLTAQLSFLLAADGLKNVIRTCNLADGSRCENSAEHSWQVALMAIVLVEHCPHPVNLGRVLELLTIHDLVEVYAGDTVIYDTEAVAGQAEREAVAASKLFGLLPADQGETLLARWRESEERSTPEASYARAIDALAPTWLHWGEHANPEPEGLTVQQVMDRKSEFLEPYPGLFEVLEHVLASASARGLVIK